MAHVISQRRLWPELLDAGLAIARTGGRPYRLPDLAKAQDLFVCQNDWKSFEQCFAQLDHFWDVRGTPRWGFEFILKLALMYDANALDRWTCAQRAEFALSALTGVLVGARADTFGVADLSPLLNARNPKLKLLAAASVVAGPPTQDISCEFEERWVHLTTGGINPADAIWMAGMLLKQAVHQRYRTEGTIHNHQARLRYIERRPEAALGWPMNPGFPSGAMG